MRTFDKDRRDLVLTAAAATLATATRPLHAAASAPACAAPACTTPASAPLGLADIAAAMSDGRLTARQLTQTYLERITAWDRRGPRLGAVLETNPRALEIAAALDQERRATGPRGPLHGMPVL